MDEPIVCSACGRSSQAGARFCSACGTRLDEPAGAPREERKMVSVVFVDLVGYTQRAEGLDPEEARTLLAGYWEGVRRELEQVGGTVEKYIGDAVVGLFGAPAAHEDDAERAVRAALAIRDRARGGEGPALRAAVATGVALVRLDAHVALGEAMVVGDVVNTAARLQAAAPVAAVLVDDATYRATRDAVRYEPRPAVDAKGKQEPVRVWEALEARTLPGVHPRLGTRFVGRSTELALLRAALERVRRERSVQLVTLVGAPGIGKSRLVEELALGAAGDDEPPAWWRGRSLPYGDGVTFWAFAEAVKEQASIRSSDDPAAARGKLARLLAGLLPDEAERGWVAGHTLRLAGVDGGEGSPAAGALEAFSAWRRLLEAAAERRPLVLLLEDLQWADDGLLDFVEHLVEWAGPVPLLVLTTARPELLERRTAWAGGKANALTLSLSPLSDEETRDLLAGVLGREPGPDAVARAGGNPLYAEQFARMLLEGGDAGEALPDSVQGIIASRLDRLPPGDKAFLQDASVVGKSFRAGAVAALGGIDGADLDAALHRLERRGLVVRVGQGREPEYAFRHRLVSDVAYEQIPRAARAEKHVRAARRLEERGGLGDDAELVAHHYLRAREYALAAGLEHGELDERARLALVRAGERALGLSSFAAATRLHAAALELWPAGRAGRPRILLRHGRALWSAEAAGEGVVLEARDGLLAEGDVDAAAEAEALLSEMRWYHGDRAGAREHLDRAVELVRDRPPSLAKAHVLSRLARAHMLGALYDDAVREGRAALALAEELDSPDLQAEALNTIGSARVRAGDAGGIADVERATGLAPSSRAAVVALNNLASLYLEAGDVERSHACADEGRRLAERLGDRLHLDWFEVDRVGVAFEARRWDEALELIDRLLAGGRMRAHYLAPGLRITKAMILHARGDDATAREEARLAERQARDAGDPQVVAPTLAACAYLALHQGRRAEADALADECLRACEDTHYLPPLCAFDLSVVLVECGRAADAAAAIAHVRGASRWLEIARLYAGGDPAAAADLAEQVERGWAAAYLNLRAGTPERLERALAYFREVGAERYVREVEARLATVAA